ncbi:sugar phosphate isomerase/epimerase [Pseudomonas sp. App30]|uniref:sugar phosphate isomerase/epimerase family protein n=1 Tax=Pseudomonas sp. App30 TaxID=3068990 RepID=UPI003A813106
MPRLLVFQSLWAMLDHQGRATLPLEAQLEQIAAAGFDGITDHYWQPAQARRLSQVAGSLGLAIEGQVFPRTVDDLAAALDVASQHGCHHLTVQADVRAGSLGQVLPLLQGWQRLIEQVDFPVLVETHRYRVTNDLPFTLQLLAELPELKLLADLSHYVVGRELPEAACAEDDEAIHQVLRRSWGFHGRVASSEQVQVGLAFPQHQAWVQRFLGWWQWGMRDWLARPGTDQASLSFTCELGPPPYAITDAHGLELTDRWQEALYLKQLIRDLWCQACR